MDILLLLLERGELSVSEIASSLNRKMNTISRNLNILEKDNFVKVRHSSINAFYSIKKKDNYKYNQKIIEILKQRLAEIKKPGRVR